MEKNIEELNKILEKVNINSEQIEILKNTNNEAI